MKNDVEQMLDQKLAHLKLEKLSAGYGPFLVLRELSLEARPGLTVILGPNGAGKTTLLKAVNGLIPRGGKLVLDGETIPRDAKTSELVQRGLVLVPEGRQLFPQMTVRENLELGGWLVNKAEREKRIEQAFKDFPKLAQREQQLAGTMSGGEQQMLAMGRALMAQPKVLLLDEPSMGLSPIMVDKIFEVVADIHARGTTVLLVEQNASRALGLANRGYVMESGEVTMTGEAKALLADPKVRAAYLGE